MSQSVSTVRTTVGCIFVFILKKAVFNKKSNILSGCPSCSTWGRAEIMDFDRFSTPRTAYKQINFQYMQDNVFTLPVRMYWEDTDAGGIVYHANYLRYMERARTEMLRLLGYEQETMKREGMALIVVANIEISYRRPAKLDDLLTVQTRMTQIRHASVLFDQSIWRGEELIVQASVRCASIDPVKGCPVLMPEEIYNKLLPYVCTDIKPH